MQTGFFSAAAFLQGGNLPAGGGNRAPDKGRPASHWGGVPWETFAFPAADPAPGLRRDFSAVYREQIGAVSNAKKPASPDAAGGKQALKGREEPRKAFPERQASPKGEKLSPAAAPLSSATVPAKAGPVDEADAPLSSKPTAGQEGQFHGEGEAGAAPAGVEGSGLMEESNPVEPVLQAEGLSPAEEETGAALAAGDLPEGAESEEMLLQPGASEEADGEGSVLKGQDPAEPGGKDFSLDNAPSPEKEDAGAHPPSAEATAGEPVPEGKNPAKARFAAPAETTSDDGAAARQQERHDAQSLAAIAARDPAAGPSPDDVFSSGKSPPPESEEGVRAEGFAGALAKEGDENVEVLFDRQAGSPAGGESGEREAGGKALGDANTAAGGGREKNGAFSAGAASSAEETPEPGIDLFSPAEVEEPLVSSLQDHESNAAGAAENRHLMPGSLRSEVKMPLLMDFSGEIIPQIVEQAGQLAMTGAEELRLRLQPEFLGEVLIRVRRLQGVLTAEIVAQDLAVRELLASQLEALRQRFQEVNLPVEHLSVSVQAEGEHGSASLAGDAGGHDFSGAAGTGGEGGGENVPEEEDGVLSPALWEAGQRVNYLA